MEIKLQEIYENSESPLIPEKWIVDSRCAVKIDKWYRAIIEEVLPDEKQIRVCWNVSFICFKEI